METQKLKVDDLINITSRPTQSNKYNYGSLLVVAGSVGYYGAATLACLSGYRQGSGLVTLLLQTEDFLHYSQLTPEVMVFPYDNIQQFKRYLHKKNAVLFGPGLKINTLNQQVLSYLLTCEIPLVIDATGLNMFKQHINSDYRNKSLVVTPHMGEAKGLFDSQEPFKEIDKLTNKKITFVIKDSITTIIQGDIKYCADYGNPGMATAGSGDVLSGMIVSLLGQNYSDIESAKLGVYLHQMAGKIACQKYGENSMIASDIINSIPAAITSYIELKKG
jgi:ADP-dependent NAD(P)H-hydrate dehydratase / NAD(P)H-hydrate epimerase